MTLQPASRSRPPADRPNGPPAQAPGRRRLPLLPILLIVLALLDLRVELQILRDHFTLTSLAEAIRAHLLAVSVLVFSPTLLRRFSR